MAEGFQGLVQTLIETLNEVSSIGDYIKSHRKECTNLARRLKLLAPLFEEARDSKGPYSEQVVESFENLKTVLAAAKEILSKCHSGSKIHLVLKKDEFAGKFQYVNRELENVLDSLPYSSLDLSEEVREQVELLHAQLRRAKAREEAFDAHLLADIAATLRMAKDEREGDLMAVERVAEKLSLKTVADLKEESRAVQNMVVDNVSDVVADVCHVLRKLKEIAIDDDHDDDEPYLERARSNSIHSCLDKCTISPPIPEDFRCPISLELMKDPVIVATGQTYERAYIQNWLDAGHKTCPITQQTLPHLVLTPNYVLRSLIGQWCETNGIELPKRVGCSRSIESSHHHPHPHPHHHLHPHHQQQQQQQQLRERAVVEALVQKLRSEEVDVRRAAVGEVRMLAKRNIENRVYIAEAGGIPLLIGLLSSTDSRTQEHAVTALLNLSIHDENKGQIVGAGAIEPIVEVVKKGSMEARENAAATLFSLSVVDENKVTIGASGAIPALVELLCEGSVRGKKDAATALFNLSIYQGNKARAVRAGIVGPLMKLLEREEGGQGGNGMVDEALAILAILATHPEGRVCIGKESTVPILVELIRNGSARNKENAAAVLLALGQSDVGHVIFAHKMGARVALCQLAESGTSRARRKASSILQLFNSSSSSIPSIYH